MSERLSAMIFKVILPVLAISFMVLFCYPVCNKPEGFDFFLFLDPRRISIWHQTDVVVADTEELRHCRLSWCDSPGLYRWRDYRRVYGYCGCDKSGSNDRTGHNGEVVMHEGNGV